MKLEVSLPLSSQICAAHRALPKTPFVQFSRRKPTARPICIDKSEALGGFARKRTHLNGRNGSKARLRGDRFRVLVRFPAVS
jgi:hypothetical protein